MVIERQLSHVQQKRLGFDRENVLVIETRGGLDDNAAALKHELLHHSLIERVSLTYATPGRPFAVTSIRSDDVEGSEISDGDPIIAEVNWADYDYASTLGLELIEGRDFSRDRASDEGGVIINETAQQVFGWDKPLGKKVQGYSIIGVVRDFHVTSLRKRVRPTILHGSPLDATSSNRVLVRLNPGNIPEALDFIKATWESFVPSIPFDYSFLDEDFDAMYRAERRLGRILLMFTGIAVLLGCMGLFGIAAFTAQQRTKEIGIRKVLGATSGGIIRLLTVEFAQLVLIAALVAAPVAYVGASRWLEHFAYRVALGPGTLVLAGLVALTAAMATVAYHAWQTARMNPADSLRYE